jgi:hypothetical protein
MVKPEKITKLDKIVILIDGVAIGDTIITASRWI